MAILRSRANQPRRAIADSSTDSTPPTLHRSLLKRGFATVLVSGLAVAALAAFTTSSANSATTAFAGQAQPVADVATIEPTVSVADLAAARVADLDSTEDAIYANVRNVAAVARSTDLVKDADAIAKEIDRLENLAKFIWPTDGSVSSPYGQRLHPILHYYRMHDGDDIGGKCGQPIYAAQSGTVVKAAMGYNGGSGNNVRIDHGDINGDNVQTGYLHMSDYIVQVGDKVDQGQLLGHVGNTGLSTACHLHFSAYKNGSGTDPMEWIGWNSEAKGDKSED